MLEVIYNTTTLYTVYQKKDPLQFLCATGNTFESIFMILDIVI